MALPCRWKQAIIATDPGLYFRLSCMITLVGGTMFLMWLGEQITARGIGNGISLIIFVGIIAEVPAASGTVLCLRPFGRDQPCVIVGVLLMVIGHDHAFVVFMERALRKIHIQYPRRQVGMKMYDGGSSHLPVKVNPAGVIPAIFASSLLLLPVTISTFGPIPQARSCRLAAGQLWPRSAALSAVLCRDDCVLCLFLHVQRQLQT